MAPAFYFPSNEPFQQQRNGQQEQCTRLAAGFANLPYPLCIFVLIVFEFALLCTTIVMLSIRHSKSAQATEQDANGDAANATLPDHIEPSASGTNEQDAASATRLTEAHNEGGIPSFPPPDYSPNTITHEPESPHAAQPLSDSTTLSSSPETRTFVNATIFLVLHTLVLILCGFITSRILYCPPDAIAEAFPGSILWIVYAAQVMFLVARLGYWLDALGDLYPDNRRPRLAKAFTAWFVLMLPIGLVLAPLSAAYHWAIDRVEKWRLKLQNETNEEVGLEEIGEDGSRAKTKGEYRAVRQEIDFDNDAELREQDSSGRAQ